MKFDTTDYYWDISVQQETTGATPNVDLLDDANNDGSVNCSDQPYVNVDPGNVILVSDPSQDPTGNADSAHLAQMQISVTPNTSNGQTPADLSGWTVTLSPTAGASSIKIWDSLSKTNELDSGGIATFTIPSDSTTYSNSDVYVEATDPGEYTFQVTLTDTSGNDQGSATAVVTADKAELVAQKVDGVNDDGSPTLNGDLNHGDTAYVPVDNEDQYYVENGHTLVPNTDQSSVTNDWALLPVKVHLPKGIDGTFELKFPDSIRVFTGPNVDPENKVISEGTSIDRLVDGNGDTTVYVEGVERDGNVQIQLEKLGLAQALDTLKVNVFEISGPENVPNYSTYDYKAVGISPVESPPTGNRWSVGDTDGSIATEEDVDAAQIHWGRGARVGQAMFAASSDYAWTFFVNIVEVSFYNPGGGFVYGGSGATLPEIPQGTAALMKRFTSSLIFPNTAGIEYTTKVALKGFEQRGVDQMRVGFIQTVNEAIQQAAYSNDHLLTNVSLSDLRLPLLDYPRGTPGPWYRTADDATFFNPTADVSTKVIGADDTPRVFVPMFYEQGKSLGGTGDGSLQFVNIHMEFRTDISVATADLAGTGVYTALGFMTWTWDSSGAVSSDGFQFDPNTGDGVASTDKWFRAPNGGVAEDVSEPGVPTQTMNKARWE